MNYTAEDFIKAIMALFPSGPIWNRSKGSFLYKLHFILAISFSKNANDAFDLLRDAFPSSSVFLLPEWEKTLGLPNKCFGDKQSLQQRRASVISRLTNNGGSSVQYYTDLAKSLGFEISIEEFSSAKAGRLKAGKPCWGKIWNNVWRITISKISYQYFKAGTSKSGDPIRTWQLSALPCLLSSIVPVNTILIFREI
ncbi:DUF2313 domain-containing protein [Acetobacteraceae bacterium]|nr:DUF2313 domain-containing protein [Acetobacteraceae bacterium]